jgi:DNA repair protein RadA/Sms
VVFGEIGLSGEVRPVSREDARLKEAGKLGFRRAILPESRGSKRDRDTRSTEGMRTIRIRHLNELMDVLRALRRDSAPKQAAGAAP